jgi:AcrR family transcriptional regulator
MRGGDPSAPLPRGPHGLSRDEVQRSQRQRLLSAMAEAVGANGYVNTSVADVLARAKVSRATFYAMFRDKAECFRAAYEEAAGILAHAMATELEAARAEGDAQALPDPLRRIDRVLTVYLKALQDAPALARTFLVEVYAAGPRAVEQRRASLDAFVDILVEAHRGTPGPLGAGPHQRFAAETIVHAISSMVTHRVGVGETDRLLDLREPLLALAKMLNGQNT